MKTALLFATFCVLTSQIVFAAVNPYEVIDAQPNQAEEERLEKLHSATTPTEFFDLATPEEIEAKYGPFPKGEARILEPGASMDGFTVRADVFLTPEPGAFQHMIVRYPGMKSPLLFKVSGGAPGHGTPAGCGTVDFVNKDHKSSLYGNAPMPWAVFFNGNIAVHATFDIDNLGRPASHGCVRLHPTNAEIFYNLVKEHGQSRVVICVHK